MQLTDKLLGKLHTMSDVQTVLYDSPYFANLKLDRKPEPYAIMYMLNSIEIDITSFLKESVDIEIFFCKKAPLDGDGMAQQAIVDDMMDIAKQFIALVKSDNTIAVDDTIVMKTAYGKFDKNVTGVSVQMKVHERQSKCLDSVETHQREMVISENGEYDVTDYAKVIVNVNA